MKVAIIGAGPMGLGVAYQLVKEGHTPIVYEADDRVGGMSASFNFGGVEIERFYHFHCISDVDLMIILSELGLQEKLVWKHTKMGYYMNEKLQDWGDPISLMRFRGIGIISKLRYGLHMFYSTKISNWKPLDEVGAIAWIKKWEGVEAFEKLWSSLFYLKFYEYSEGISAAWIWARIKRVGTSRQNIFKEKLGYIVGGCKTLLNSICSFIESRGGRVKLNSPVEKIVIEGDKVVGVLVNNEFKNYDVVVSTIPLPYIPKLAPDLPEYLLNMYKSIVNIGVVCVVLKLKQPVSKYFWININDPSMDIPGLIEFSNLNNEYGHIVYVPYYLPQSNPKFNYKDDFFAEKTIEYIKKINPLLKGSDIIGVAVNRYYYAQPVCTINFAKRLPPPKTPVRGLWIADTSHYYPNDRGLSQSIGFGRFMAKEVINDCAF